MAVPATAGVTVRLVLLAAPLRKAVLLAVLVSPAVVAVEAALGVTRAEGAKAVAGCE